MERLPNILDQDPKKQWQSQSDDSTNGSKLAPMGRETAVKLVRRLLAGYPNLSAHDPEGYLAVMIETMEKYPQWAGERTTMRVDERNNSFPPTEKDLRSWLEEFMSPARFATAWDGRARLQISERRDDVDTAPKFSGMKGDGGPGTIYDFSRFDEAVAKHGRPRGRFEVEKPVRTGNDRQADELAQSTTPQP